MFTAFLQRQFRDVKTSIPKVLLTNITFEGGTLFRDHCWVELTDELLDFVPRKCGLKLMVTFDAQQMTYYSGKTTLQDIKNITKKFQRN